MYKALLELRTVLSLLEIHGDVGDVPLHLLSLETLFQDSESEHLDDDSVQVALAVDFEGPFELRDVFCVYVN